MAQAQTGARMARTTFLVGRLTPRSVQIVVMDDSPAPPIPGPWTLKGLVRSNPSSRVEGYLGPTVH